MVGVPISKGCALCLKRSIKCDEARPSCSQCRRGGRACPGYQRVLRFVDEGPRVRRVHSRGKAQDHGRTANHATGRTGIRSAAVSTRVKANEEPSWAVATRDRGSAQRVTGWRPAYSGGPLVLESLSLERAQILASFVASMFPLDRAATQQRSYLGGWLWHVPPRLGRGDAIDHAALALALAYFARVQGDDAGHCQAQQAYTAALRSLSRMLADAETRCDADALCAAMLLSHYESFANISRAWIQHAGGVARLLQLRGARRCYDSPFAYSMFLTCRGAIITEALVSAAPCFLDTAEWKAVPDGLIDFPLMPHSPKLYHEMFAHLAAVPGLVHRVKALKNDVSVNTRRSVAASAHALRRDIRAWYEQYMSTDGGRHRPLLVQAYPARDDTPFPSLYRYEDVMSASVLTNYYAYHIIINRAIERAEGSESSSNYEKENGALAQQISMSVDYCSRAGYCGSQVMRFCLPVAHSALPVSYHAWLEAWMAKFGGHLDASRILVAS